MKVLQISPYYWPHIGGITSYVSNLIRYLERIGIQVSGLALEGETDPYVSCLGGSKLAFVSRAVMYLKESEPHVIHSHSHWYALAPGVLYKRLERLKKLVFSFHTDPTSSLPLYSRWGHEELLSRCDVITFVCNYLRERLTRLLNIKAKTLVVPPGVVKREAKESDVERFVSRWHLGSRKPILTFIGPLVWRKKVEGVKRLISAFAKVNKELPSSRLVIVGDGPFKKDLVRHTTLCGVSESVVFPGLVEDSRAVLGTSDIYTHISMQEGLPIALLEAMSAGLPIVASKIGGIPEAMANEKEGLLVSTDPDEIAEKILSLWSDEGKRERLGRAAALRAEREFSWIAIAKKFFDIYSGRRP